MGRGARRLSRNAHRGNWVACQGSACRFRGISGVVAALPRNGRWRTRRMRFSTRSGFPGRDIRDARWWIRWGARSAHPRPPGNYLERRPTPLWNSAGAHFCRNVHNSRRIWLAAGRGGWRCGVPPVRPVLRGTEYWRFTSPTRRIFARRKRNRLYRTPARDAFPPFDYPEGAFFPGVFEGRLGAVW